MAKKKQADAITPHIRDEFFVSISEPSRLQVLLLQGNKTVLESKKVFEELKQIRQQKTEQKRQLRKQMRYLSISLGKLTQMLPHVHFNLKEEKPVEAEETEEKAQQEKPKSVAVSQIDKIEEQLREIESKLSSLQ